MAAKKTKKAVKKVRKSPKYRMTKDRAAHYNPDGTPKNKDQWVEQIISSVGDSAIYGTEIRY